MAERNRLVSATARVLQDRHGVRDPLTASQLAQTALARRSRGRGEIQLPNGILFSERTVYHPVSTNEVFNESIELRPCRDTHKGSTHGRRSNVAGGHVRFQPLVDRCEEDHLETMYCDPNKKYR